MSGACRIAVLSVGRPVPFLCADGSSMTSSIAGRRPVDHPVPLGLEGFEGDACAAKVHHGEYMRVLAHGASVYPALEHFSGRTLRRPSLGENLLIEGLTEAEVRVGDVFRAQGGAVMRVTQPREPCSNIPRYLGLPGVLKWMVSQPVTGFYLGVVEPGMVEPGGNLEVLERGPEGWTIERLNRVMYQQPLNGDLVSEVLGLEALSPRWKSGLEKLATRQRARRETPA